MIHSVRQDVACQSCPPRPVSAPARHGFRGSRAEGITQRSASLEVTTEDGDKVSISFSAVQQFQVAKGRVRDGVSRGRVASASSSTSVSVEVKIDGELDDQEVADISKLLESLTRAASRPALSLPTPAAAPAPAPTPAAPPVPAPEPAAEPTPEPTPAEPASQIPVEPATSPVAPPIDTPAEPVSQPEAAPPSEPAEPVDVPSPEPASQPAPVLQPEPVIPPRPTLSEAAYLTISNFQFSYREQTDYSYTSSRRYWA